VISFMVRGQTQTRVVYKQAASPAPEVPEKPVQAEEKPEEKKAEETLEPEAESEESDS